MTDERTRVTHVLKRWPATFAMCSLLFAATANAQSTPPSTPQTARATTPTTTQSTPRTTTQPTSQSAALVVTNAWARPALAGGTGGAYMTLHNNGSTPVRITVIQTTVAKTAEVHESSEHNGMMHMTMKPALDIPAGGTVTLKPGGLHVMLVNLKRALVPGDTMHLSLIVESHPTTTVGSTTHRTSVPVTVVVHKP